MIRLFITFTVLFYFICFTSFGQNNDSLFSRLQGISNSGTDFFNVDGIEITSQSSGNEFSKKNVLKKFKKYSIKESDLNSSDSLIDLPNFYVSKTKEICAGTIQNTSYYFIENSNKGLTAITFGSINKKNRDFERQFVKLINDNNIPRSIYAPLQIDSINFSGRKIALGGSCRWMGINNVQCPYYGQMNWSVHKTFGDASNSVDNQFNIIKAKKNGKIISEELVDVIFEGTETKARKVIFDFKGVTSLVAGMSGGKTLTIYFVAAPGRQNFVSCVMSFWNNDNVNPSGLPPLLEQVMKLKK
jgi:hypothetical protein